MIEKLEFPEDDPKVLGKMISSVDRIMKEHPEWIVEPSPEFLKLVDALVDGVIIDESE